MIIPQPTILRAEDYDANVQSWIGRLLSPLNTFMTNATSAINGNLTASDNFLGQQKVLTFTFSSNTLPLSFASTFKGTPTSLQVVAATENGVPVIVLAAWANNSSSIRISDLVKLSGGAVSALTTGASYNLTVRVAA